MLDLGSGLGLEWYILLGYSEGAEDRTEDLSLICRSLIIRRVGVEWCIQSYHLQSQKQSCLFV